MNRRTELHNSTRHRADVIAVALICMFVALGRFVPPSCPAAASIEARRLTRDGDFKQHLQWSPDGQKFLFTRIHQGKMGLWIMNADGGDLKRLFNHDEGPDFDGHWSPD